jgi:hypothetical protein
VTRKKPRTGFPDRKISETFLHFAEPLLDGLGPHATDDQMEQSLKIAFTVWNAVVYEAVNGETRYIDMVRESTRDDPEVARVIAFLIARKHNRFGHDHRLIGEFKLTYRDGQRRLWAEARDPRPSKRPNNAG